MQPLSALLLVCLSLLSISASHAQSSTSTGTANTTNSGSNTTTTTGGANTTTTTGGSNTTTTGGANTTTTTTNSSDLDKLRGEFGIGLAVIRLRKPQIDTAEVRGGVVRIVDETKTRITPWLQAQYVYDKWGGPYLSPGMFVGLGLGSSGTTFDTFGIGVLLAQKRTRSTDRTDTRALNIGLGVYTTKYKTLSDEAEEGQPLPVGVESVNYRTKSQSGLVLTVSFAF